MDTKTYLQQISRLDRMINNKLSEIQQFRELARSVSAVKNEERVKTSPNFDKMGSTYCKIEKMEKELDDLIDTYVDKRILLFHKLMELTTKLIIIFCLLGMLRKRHLKKLQMK